MLLKDRLRFKTRLRNLRFTEKNLLGLGIPEMSALNDPSQIELLYWVGCVGSYDERNQKVSRALTALMKQAGVKFAILGREERCNGNPARRLGNEYLYEDSTITLDLAEVVGRSVGIR